MLSEDRLKPLYTIDGYRRHFMDVELWQPYIESVCLRHNLLPCNAIRAGLAGTFPTFMVNEQWVIKLFGPLFEGEASFQAERQANSLLTAEPSIPAPRLLDTAPLFGESAEWAWPYLIFPFVPSVSIGEVYEDVSADDHIALAHNLGGILRRLHLLSLGEKAPLAKSWQPYRIFLQRQFESCYSRHREWGTLPKHLLAQLNAYVLPPDEIIDEHTTPHLIHGDVTADHILGKVENQHWKTLALIDFGDAMAANLAYELVALHFDLFRSHKERLLAFLDSYGLSLLERQRLPHQAMSVTLLHNFDVLKGIFASGSSAHNINSLEELATVLWDVDSPLYLEL